jgi:hypothetical protein
MRNAIVLIVALVLAGQGRGADFDFREQELKTRLTVGYAVRLIDMNDDKRLDICIVDSERLLWLENPNWDEHIMIGAGKTKKDNVCFAPADIDGDGRLDFAVGADWNPGNTKSGGTIQWIRQPERGGEEWPVFPIGEEPTMHRMQFADFDGDGRPELIAAPLLGRDTTKPNFAENGCRLLSFKIPKDPVKGPWTPEVIDDSLHVSHNIWPTDFDGDGKLDLLVVSFEGVFLLERSKEGKWSKTKLGIGEQETMPNKGASEIKHGKFAGGDYIATIEPWHGSEAVVYTRPQKKDALWDRHVLDDDLAWGHAVWCVNLDDDADQELVIGVRDNKSETSKCGVRIFDPQEAGKSWQRTLVDPGGVAVEDLQAGDLNGDGRADIVAVGRATHNVKIYWGGK